MSPIGLDLSEPMAFVPLLTDEALLFEQVRFSLNRDQRQPYERRERNGRMYLVVKATSIVPGVLNGSQGSLFYHESQIRRSVPLWDGMPITVNHPFHLGQTISANDLPEEKRIGFLHNTRYEGKLTHECWFDEQRTKAEDPRVYNAIINGQPMELSTGLYTSNRIAEPGANYKGRSFDFYAENYVPDHLAILPDQVGACSIHDGCGLNINKENRLGGEASEISSQKLKQADFITLPSGVKGTNCLNCRFVEKDGDGYVCGNDHLKGQPVNNRNCCAYWDSDGTLRDWHKTEVQNNNQETKTMSLLERFMTWFSTNVGQPSDHVSPEKACQILHDGTAQGHPLTEQQRKMFGAVCGHHSTHNTWTDAARVAAEASRHAKEATEHSHNEGWSSPQHFDRAYQAHLTASNAHWKAMHHAREEGNHREAEKHERASESHYSTAHMFKQAKESKPFATNEYIGFDKLSKHLEEQGHSAESAKAIAAAIGRKKYGKEGMSELSHEGKVHNAVIDEPFTDKTMENLLLQDELRNKPQLNEGLGQPRDPMSGQYLHGVHSHALRGFHHGALDAPTVVGAGMPTSTPPNKPDFEGAEDELSEYDAPAELVGKQVSPDGRDIVGLHGTSMATPMMDDHMAYNTWSDAARQAAKASRIAHEHTKKNPLSTSAIQAHEQAAKAHKEAGNHAKSKAHKEVADLIKYHRHWNAVQAAGTDPSSRTEGPYEESSKSVLKKSREALQMKGTNNMSQVFNLDFGSLPREAQKAAFAHMASGGGHSSTAARASHVAMKSGEAHHHAAAAMAHKEAYEHHAEAGNEHTAELHKAAYKYHARASKAGKKTHNAAVDMTRREVLAIFTANCSCDKEKKVLNEMSDEALGLLVRNSQSFLGSGSDSIQAGGEEHTYSDPGKDLEEETEVGDQDIKGKKKTVNQWLAEAPPEGREVLNRMMKFNKDYRQSLLNRLTANMSEPAKKKALAIYNKQSTSDLEELAQAIPTQNNGGFGNPFVTGLEDMGIGREMPPEQSYLGAAGGVYNAGAFTGHQSAGEVVVNEEWPPVLKYEKKKTG